MKTLLTLSFLMLTLASYAQPITVTASSSQGSGGFAGGTAGTYQDNVSHSNTIAGSSYTFNLRGDVTAQMSGSATSFAYQSSAFFTLMTGAAPVRLTGITVAYNGKEVVSGGSTATYRATNFYRGTLYAGSFGADFFYGAYLPERNAQGVYIEDLSNALPDTILAANTQYTLYMDVYPVIDVTSYPVGSSMLGYTLEYGGTVSPQFDGVTVMFDAEAVPEPATMTILGLGLAALAARKRRS